METTIQAAVLMAECCVILHGPRWKFKTPAVKADQLFIIVIIIDINIVVVMN